MRIITALLCWLLFTPVWAQTCGPCVFTSMPEVHAASGDATPIFGRTATDGKTVGAWNAVDDSIAGDLLHLTTGPNKALNANGAVIAVGVKYGGRAVFVNNYGASGSGSSTVGFSVVNLAGIDNVSSFGFLGSQFSTLSPLVRYTSNVANGAPLLQFRSYVTDSKFLDFYSGQGQFRWAQSGSVVNLLVGSSLLPVMSFNMDTGQKIAFNGATPVARQTLPAALPTDGSADNATRDAMANALRTLLINAGLAQ